MICVKPPPPTSLPAVCIRQGGCSGNRSAAPLDVTLRSGCPAGCGPRPGARPEFTRAVDPPARGCHTQYAILGMEVPVSVRHSLLALLSAGPTHGYGLKTEFEAATGEVWPLNVGQVYTTLGRLERDGLVTAGADADGQKVYEITEAGRDELGRWFETPVPREVAPRQEL